MKQKSKTERELFIAIAASVIFIYFLAVFVFSLPVPKNKIPHQKSEKHHGMGVVGLIMIRNWVASTHY